MDSTLNRMEAAFIKKNAARNAQRGHLGLSTAGSMCTRKLWYGFRWVQEKEEATARLQRLWRRGDREEAVFIELLRDAGVTVYDLDTNGKQFNHTFSDGHGGGSMDAVLVNTAEFGLEPALGEFKTHNDASFNRLVTQGLTRAHFSHYIQMQMYMKAFHLRVGLYFAVNKNNDELHVEKVLYAPLVAERFYKRMEGLVWLKEPPPRIAKSPSEWACVFCPYKKICFRGEGVLKNCRTCKHSEPLRGGNALWACKHTGESLPLSKQRKGCLDYEVLDVLVSP